MRAFKKLLRLLCQEFKEKLLWDVAESAESVRGDFGRSWGVPAPSPLPTHPPREADAHPEARPGGESESRHRLNVHPGKGESANWGTSHSGAGDQRSTP